MTILFLIRSCRRAKESSTVNDAVDLALLERQQHARGRDVAEDHLDRRAVGREHGGDHRGRRGAAERAEAQGLRVRLEIVERLDAGARTHEHHRVHRTGTADIDELGRVEGRARILDDPFDEPRAAGDGERQPVGRDPPAEMVGGNDTAGAFHVLDHEAGLPRNEPHQMARHHARRGVDAAARRKADDHRQRLALVEVVGARGASGERGRERAETGQHSPARRTRHHAPATRPPASRRRRCGRPHPCPRGRAGRSAAAPWSRWR